VNALEARYALHKRASTSHSLTDAFITLMKAFGANSWLFGRVPLAFSSLSPRASDQLTITDARTCYLEQRRSLLRLVTLRLTKGSIK